METETKQSSTPTKPAGDNLPEGLPFWPAGEYTKASVDEFMKAEEAYRDYYYKLLFAIEGKKSDGLVAALSGKLENKMIYVEHKGFVRRYTIRNVIGVDFVGEDAYKVFLKDRFSGLSKDGLITDIILTPKNFRQLFEHAVLYGTERTLLHAGTGQSEMIYGPED